MKFATALAIFTGFVASSPVSGNDTSGDVGHKMEFGQFSHGGTGCPQNSIGYTLSEDGSLLNLKYDSLSVYADKDVPIPDRRKFCQLNMELFVPNGWQFSVMQTDYRGYCYLEDGLTGYQKATYYFSGSTNQLSRETKFYGPKDGDYLVSDRMGVTSNVWSPCGSSVLLNLKQEVGIKPFGGEKMGMMDVASSDHKLEQVLHLQWRKCTV